MTSDVDLNKLFQPRMVDRYMLHTPHPVQQLAMSLNNRELLFGGAAGGGKSDWALMTALQYVDVPGYSALILRRTWYDLINSGAILQRFQEWMAPYTKGKEVQKKDEGRSWIFPSGARISFGYAARDDDKLKFQGAEYQTVIFDEGTQFEESIYRYLLSRLRRPALQCVICDTPLLRTHFGGVPAFKHQSNEIPCGQPLPDQAVLDQYPAASDGMTIFDIPLRMRVTANPGGRSHLFFRDRFINPDTRVKDTVFIPSALKDNPSLDAATYMQGLAHLSVVDRERLMNGNWEVMDEGALFNREDFQMLPEPPHPAEVKQRVRCWDFAASDGQKSDYTAGALVSLLHDGRIVIEDMKHVKLLPPQVEDLVRRTAYEDELSTRIYSEQEPGSAGKTVASYYARKVLPGFQYKAIRATGSKTDRAGALVSQVAAKNVFFVQGAWNNEFMDEASTFPTGAHDDQVDAAALAINQLLVSDKRKIRIVI